MGSLIHAKDLEVHTQVVTETHTHLAKKSTPTPVVAPGSLVVGRATVKLSNQKLGPQN